jgi:YqaJ-like viral recombinase domain
MPDNEQLTISATESPALFGVSPYITKWMLWHRFSNGRSLDTEKSNRMDWGKKMEPIIREQVAKEMRLEVVPNEERYIRRNNLGCTRDATIICPDRGPGALEIKCVFDYASWMQKWNGGKMVPRHIEIQLQQQCFVGDESGPYQWGLIVAWCAAELYYFERKPIPKLWVNLACEAEEFFRSIAAKEEPDPFGSPIEIPWLTEMFPTIKDSVLDLSADPDHVKTSEKVSMYKYLKEQEAGGKSGAEKLRAELLSLARDHELVLLPCGVNFKVQRAGTGKSIKVYVPDIPLPLPVGANIMMGG